MSVIGEFTVPSDSFLLGETMCEVPEVVVELERVVAHSHDRVVPFFWVQQGDCEAFDELVRDDPTLEDVVRLDDFESGTSYRGTWKEHAEGVAYAYIEAGGTILEATGQGSTWTMRMRFDDDDSVAAFHQFCNQEEISFQLEQLYHPSHPRGGGQYGLTDTERETLVDALDHGYYEVPRETSMTELADELGTSQQNLSKRFRNAHAALVENTLVVADEAAMTPDDD